MIELLGGHSRLSGTDIRRVQSSLDALRKAGYKELKDTKSIELMTTKYIGMNEMFIDVSLGYI